MAETTQQASGIKWTVLAPLLAAILLAGCTRSKSPERLVFADPNSPIATLIYVAQAQGFFKGENLTISYRKFTSGRDALNSVLAGESDFGVATEFPFANNILHGNLIHILGSVQRTNHNAAVVARRDRGIATVADLKGKRIGIAPRTNTEFVLSTMLREVGLADGDVSQVPTKPEQMAAALASGEVDAVATWMPHISAAQARFAAGATVLLSTPAYAELSPLGVRPQTLVAKEEALQRLVNALVKAEDFVKEHPDTAFDIFAAHFGYADRDSMRRDWETLQFAVRMDNLLLAALTNEGTWLSSRESPALTVPDYRATFVPKFLKAIRPQSVTLTSASAE